VTGGRAWRVLRWALLLVFAAYFVLPLLALLDFSTTMPATGERTGEAWRALAEDPTMTEAITTSLLLSLLTVVGMIVLLVPTMIWVRLRVPGAARLVEFLCLLPLTIPALVIVVGIRNVYAWVYYFFGSSTLLLSFVYVVLVLPYAYRSLDAGLRAIDVRTLSEAARSLGASWFTVMRRIVLPNLRSSVLSASFLSVALVLGEFTIASLFSKKNLQVAMYELGKSDAKISVAVGLLSLVFAFGVLFAMSFVGSGTAGSSPFTRLRRSRTDRKDAAA